MSSDNVSSEEKYIEEGTPPSPSKKTRTPTSKHRTPSKKTRRPTSTYFEKDYYNRQIKTARANNVAEFVEFFKEKFGEGAFTRFIWQLSTPISSTRGYSFSDSPPSFLIDIMKEFFDLLKNTPELPQIAGPFKDIIEKFEKLKTCFIANFIFNMIIKTDFENIEYIFCKSLKYDFLFFSFIKKFKLFFSKLQDVTLYCISRIIIYINFCDTVL